MPRQARSQDSTNRMLDTALTILARDGLDSLTIAEVSRESGVPNGSLYHRFGNRRGLLIAAQDRFLNRIEADWLGVSASLVNCGDAEELLVRIVSTFERIFNEHRALFRTFMVTGYHEPELRIRGAEASRRAAQVLSVQFTKYFGCSPQAADSAYRLLFSHATVNAIFDDAEMTDQLVPVSTRQHHLVLALRAIVTDW